MSQANLPQTELRPPVISIVGRPDCGKTTLLEKLIPLLTGQGLRIGVIKHHVHAFEMDKPGKDTWKIKQAGASVVALSSPNGLGVIRDTSGDTPVEELVARYFSDLDLVFTEGYKQEGLPKIEVFRSALHPNSLPRNDSWIAMVSDRQIHADLPHFLPEDVAGLCDFLVDRFIKPGHRPLAVLIADGKRIPLNRFVESFLRQAVLGMTASLKGVERPMQLTLTLNDE